MATVPVPGTATAGAVATAAVANTWRDAANFLLGNTVSGSRKALAVLRQGTVQSVVTATWTSLTFDTEDVDYDSGHSTSSNTSRYTAQTAGYYLCAGGASFASNATGLRGGRLAVNGAALNGTESKVVAVTGDITGVAVHATLVLLGVGDYVELQGYQTSGANLNTAVATSQQSSLHVLLVSN